MNEKSKLWAKLVHLVEFRKLIALRIFWAERDCYADREAY